MISSGTDGTIPRLLDTLFSCQRTLDVMFTDQQIQDRQLCKRQFVE